MNIFLIGFMGCGKSTIGKSLAKSMKCQFLDTDLYIEKQQHMSVSDIFAQKGEEYFRYMETQVLKKLSVNEEYKIIAVGGGLVVRTDNQKLIKEKGKAIYLRTSIDTLERRLKGDTTRPLLQGGNLRNKISELIQARESIYISASDIIIDTDHKRVSDICAEIEKAVK